MTEPRLIGPSLDGVHPIFFPESVPSSLPPECCPAPSIDAAIEQVVKTGSDPEALTGAVRTLAGLLGYDLEAKQPDPAAMLVHAKFGGHHEQHGGRGEYVTPCGTVGAANLTGLWSCISCDGCIKALIDDGLGGWGDGQRRDAAHTVESLIARELAVAVSDRGRTELSPTDAGINALTEADHA
jgi:hypothetical protein